MEYQFYIKDTSFQGNLSFVSNAVGIAIRAKLHFYISMTVTDSTEVINKDKFLMKLLGQTLFSMQAAYKLTEAIGVTEALNQAYHSTFVMSVGAKYLSKLIRNNASFKTFNKSFYWSNVI